MRHAHLALIHPWGIREGQTFRTHHRIGSRPTPSRTRAETCYILHEVAVCRIRISASYVCPRLSSCRVSFWQPPPPPPPPLPWPEFSCRRRRDPERCWGSDGRKCVIFAFRHHQKKEAKKAGRVRGEESENRPQAHGESTTASGLG